MSVATFDRFVQEEQEKVQPGLNAFDVEREKEVWLQSLDELYKTAARFLESYVAAGKVAIDYQPISLNEEQVGVYVAREMLITIGTKTIRLEPLGTFIFGAKGRVDVVGPVARAQLLLIDSEARSASDLIRVSVSVNGGPPSPPPQPQRKIQWAWRLLTRPPERKIVPLTENNFLEMLAEIGNG